jgi:phage terminase small subunit
VSEKTTELNDKQKRFADEYVGPCNLNATRAAVAAGYSKKTAYSIGHNLLKTPHVRAYIDQQLSLVAGSPSEVLTVLSRQMRGAVGDLLTDDGRIDMRELKARGLDSLIRKIDVKETVVPAAGNGPPQIERTYKVELYDAQSAAVQLGRIHKLFTDKIEHSGVNGMPLIPKDISLTINSVYGDDDDENSADSGHTDDRDGETGGDAEGTA